MIFISPQLEHAKREIDVVEVYAANCSDFTLDTIYNVMDIFAFAHFWGWGMKVSLFHKSRTELEITDFEISFSNFSW